MTSVGLSAREEHPAAQVPVGFGNMLALSFVCVVFPLFSHPPIQDFIESRKEVWSAMRVRFLVVAAVPGQAGRVFDRAEEMMAQIAELQLDRQPMSLLWQRGADAALERRMIETFGPGEAAEPGAYGSPQPDWMLHRKPAAKALRRAAKPQPVSLPQGVTIPSLVVDGAVRRPLPSSGEIVSMTDARVFEMDALPAAHEDVLARVTEQSEGSARLLRRATVLSLHGLKDRIGGALDKLKPCCECVVNSSGEAAAKGSPGSSQCGTLRWCENCLTLYWAADRCIHPGLLLDAVLSVLEDGVFADASSSASSTWAP